jgi:hypothetical protein
MSFQIIKPKQEINFIVLKNSEGTSEESSSNLNLGSMYLPQNLRLPTHSHGKPCISFVKKPHNPTFLSHSLRENRTLGPTVDKCLHLHLVNEAGDIEHCCMSEQFGVEFLGMLQILRNIILLNQFFNSSLSISIKWVFVESSLQISLLHSSSHNLSLSSFH